MLETLQLMGQGFISALKWMNLLAMAGGVALGIMVHTSAAMLGISAVIAQSVTLFTLLRYAGAAYLFWMGIHALRAGREVTAAVVRHGGQ